MPPTPRPTAAVWIGRILSTLVAVFLLTESAIDLFSPATFQAEMAATGFPAWTIPVLGIITLISAVLYVVPPTAVIGAILITGYLGGAICTHLRIGELGSPPQILAVILGASAWGGLYLRDTRIRRLFTLTA